MMGSTEHLSETVAYTLQEEAESAKARGISQLQQHPDWNKRKAIMDAI